MRRLLAVVALLGLLASTLPAQDSDPDAAVNFILLGSWAPFGLGGELFLGNLGLGAGMTFLPFGGGGSFVLLFEPLGYAHLYLGPKDSAFFVSGGLSYATMLGGDFEDTEVLDGGVLRINTGVGYNAFFGRDNSTRFAVEIGPRFNTIVVKGDSVDETNWFFVHFMLLFGKTF